MIRTLSLLVAAMAILGMAPEILAGANPEAHLALDCQPMGKGLCPRYYQSCDVIQQIYQGPGPYTIFVVLYHYSGIVAVGFGLDFSAVQDWEFLGAGGCGDLSIIQEQGGGVVWIATAWADCQFASELPPGNTGMAVAWLQLAGGPGRIDVVPYHGGDPPEVLDCDFLLDPVHTLHPGFVGGALPGPDDPPPCLGPSAAEPATWGGVKSLYR